MCLQHFKKIPELLNIKETNGQLKAETQTAINMQ